MLFRAETNPNYIEAVHLANRHNFAAASSQARVPRASASLETRSRYHQGVVSVNAIGPGVKALILVFIPAMLSALGEVRAKEPGSISNFYATPLSHLEFLFGKQLPYIAVSLLNLALLVAVNRWLFGVLLKGSVATLAFAGLGYLLATTSLGLLISAFTQTQIAAILGTMILTSLTGTALLREREHGTLDHLLVLPLTALEIMLAKICSNALVVVLCTWVSLELVVKWLIGMPLAGPQPLFLAVTALYLFASRALGIFLATLARSIPQFGLLSIPVIIPMLLLSGGTTPLDSMPLWLQWTMQISPSTHFVSLA
jgi:ABC-type multidrug transport system permease subunit